MSRSHQNSRPRRLPVTALAAVLLVAGGATALTIAARAQRSAPQPPAAAAPPSASQTPNTSGAPVPQSPPPGAPAAASSAASGSESAGPILTPSPPTQLSIPAIGVSSDLLQLGLNPDGTVEVPPLEKDSRAGWYSDSPTPGQLGPSIILGHVDSAQYGPGVFFQLGALRPGDEVSITRADSEVAVFRVDGVASYPKDMFPTLEVYSNTDHAALRLITCGGKFDLITHNYEDNIVAYASLASSHPA